ncbi:MAG: diguanylate cyclase [Clostridiales bacterium]|jgi:diguanylate cyclase (GGDEF)-like protein|nr:diguanylate cyclase [Clostridiales bacterium]
MKMDSLNETAQESNFDQKISEPILLKFNEALKMRKKDVYFEYVNSAMQLSNKKWLYLTLTSVLLLEIFSMNQYIFKALSIQNTFRQAFLFCSVLYAAFGYIFYKINKSNKTTQLNNYIVLSFMSLFILMQYFLYYISTASSQSLFCFFAASAAVALLPAVNPATLIFLTASNLGVYLIVISKYYTALAGNIYLYNSIFITVAVYFLAIYFYMSRINILISSKKMASFAENMAISNNKLNTLNSELEKMSLTDPLTKIGNRRYFEIETEKVWSHAMRSNTNVSFMLLDIDFFKLYNDYFGHPKGDQCLVAVAQAIKSSFLRKSDIIARYGGEEFAIILPCVNPEQANILANRLIENIRALKLEHPRSTASPYVSVSIGVSTVAPERGMDYKIYFTEADKALYLAKQTGRNKFCTLNSDVNNKKTNNVDELKRLMAIIKNTAAFYFSIDYSSHKAMFSSGVTDLIDTEILAFDEFSEFYKHVHPEDIKALDIFINKFFEPGHTKSEWPFRLIGKNNSHIWVKACCFLLEGPEKKPAEITGVIINIENEIHNSHIVDNLIDGKYIINLADGANRLYGEIVNQLKGSSNNNFEAFEEALLYEDKNIFRDFIKDIKSESLTNLNFEYRIKTINNQVLWLSSRNQVYNDPNGNPFLIVGLIYNLQLLNTYNKILKSDYYISPISGLPDRFKFIEDLEYILAADNVSGYLFLLDIDNFNNVNNIFSYAEGNRFLKYFGGLLNNNKLFFGKVYHFEGDLFAIIFPNMKKSQALRQLESFHSLSKTPIESNGVSYQYSISISCIEYPIFGKSVEELLINCDIALRKIKIGGKNNTLIFSNELYEENISRLKLEMELRRSVDNNMRGFILYYHPLLSAEHNICVGAEALIRWQSPDGKIYPPGAFLPSLENAGLMNSVGDWVLKTASSQCKEWLTKGICYNKLEISSDFFISINISAYQLVSDFFEEGLLNYLNEIELPCTHVTLEITESALIMDIQKGIKVLSSLRRKGIKIAIDDFGTGYSSLSYFRELPVDEIKIDRSFIIDIENDNFCKEFVNSIIKITQSINRVICVEGVENETQAEILRGFNADILQGFLYSKPIPTMEFETQFLNAPPLGD